MQGYRGSVRRLRVNKLCAGFESNDLNSQGSRKLEIVEVLDACDRKYRFQRDKSAFEDEFSVRRSDGVFHVVFEG
jgi:hypothetical protein